MFGAYSKSAGTGKHQGRSRSGGEAENVAADYAATLLASLGLSRGEGSSPSSAVGAESAAALDVAADPHPALAAAASGLMALTGRADGPPVPPPGHLAACARGTLAAFRALARGAYEARLDTVAPPARSAASRGGLAPRVGVLDPVLAALDGAELLSERAAILGLGRRGSVSVGGHCRLVRARDGWIAVNLPRPDDLATVPAWLETAAAGDPWNAIAEIVPTRGAGELVARARLLGLAAAEAKPPAATPPPWFRVAARGRHVAPDPARPPLVVDLSTLWAGPLAGQLLALAGARVLKLESERRPDGSRRGPAAFFDLLHAGKESIALDFTDPRDRRALVSMVARADIVIESARPRAMHQLGIDPAALVRARPGLTWISITAYGRGGRAGNWIGFGDDAATAAGIAAATGHAAGEATPLFCGDAIADPLTGLHAAVAALAAHRSGGGVLVALALRDVAAHALAFGPSVPAATVALAPAATRADAGWDVVVGDTRQRVLSPRARLPRTAARPFGADTAALMEELRVG